MSGALAPRTCSDRATTMASSRQIVYRGGLESDNILGVIRLVELAGGACAGSGAGGRGGESSGQLGRRAGLLGGYNMIFRYDHSPLCATAQAGKEPQKVCGHGAPLALDVAASF